MQRLLPVSFCCRWKGQILTNLSVWVPIAIVIGGALGAALKTFLDKSNWRDVAESRGAENDDLRTRVDDLEEKVDFLEAQIEGLIALKSEQIAHLVLEGIQSHRGN